MGVVLAVISTRALSPVALIALAFLRMVANRSWEVCVKLLAGKFDKWLIGSYPLRSLLPHGIFAYGVNLKPGIQLK